ncbi:MAG: phosphate acyltransferase PlsX [Anaerolineae bacterium]|nr:phosphate acyltransferase PlsX [Anaerolineae bacterium]
MRIALDAMGGDHAPDVVVEGGIQAAREYGLEIVLVGKERVIKKELAKYDTSGLSLPVVPASEVLEMDEEPARAARAKKDSSMAVGLRMVKEGQAEAFASAGNSGGVLATALFTLGRLKGVKRPALSSIIPVKTGFSFILDLGGNTDCKPEWLLQFGIMGSIYAEIVLGIQNPRVAIISNGEEEGKGNQLVKETTPLLKGSHLNFVGNVEGKDIVTGKADVIVTDGFTGNVAVKTAEGVADMLFSLLKDAIEKRPLAILGACLAQGAFKEVKRRLDYSEYGGAPLLGVKGVVIVGHGRSNAKAIKNMVRTAAEAVRGDMLGAIQEAIESNLLLKGVKHA